LPHGTSLPGGAPPAAQALSSGVGRARRSLVVLSLALGVGCGPLEDSVADPAFFAGANAPWHHYGHDLGEAWGHQGISAEPAAVTALLEALGDADAVRWFLFADGRALDADTGLTELAYDDMAALLEIAEATDTDLIPVLFDYKLLDGAAMVDGVQLFGRSEQVRAPAPLIDNLVRPWAEAFASHPRLRAIEIINEPEWAIAGPRSLVDDPVSVEQMQAFVAHVREALKATTTAPVTVGSASLDDMMSLWAEADLDEFSFHHYTGAPLTTAVNELGLSLPVWIGEVSTTTAPARDLADAQRLGYRGALLWSHQGDDEHSDRQALLSALRDFNDSGGAGRE
jgi:hypothetical protein